jgi:hypothetical protein
MISVANLFAVLVVFLLHTYIYSSFFFLEINECRFNMSTVPFVISVMTGIVFLLVVAVFIVSVKILKNHYNKDGKYRILTNISAAMVLLAFSLEFGGLDILSSNGVCGR